MPRSRLLRSALLLVGIAALLYLSVSLFLPSSRRLIFGVDKRTGEVRLVRNTITFLPPHRFYRLSFEKRDGWAQRDDFIRIESEDKVPVTISYRIRFGIEGSRIPDSRLLVRDGWNAWIRARVSEAVAAVAKQVSIEELLSPSSRFNTQRDPLRRVVAAYLKRSGLVVTGFEIARMDVDRDALLRAKRAELRRDARSVAGRVAVFAIDGADWELISELSSDGRIPNLKALIQRGTVGSVQTIQPTVAPLLWATVATGLPPDRHGVVDFIDRGRNIPVDGITRHAPAVWDIAEAFGRDSVIVNWPTAWPPSSTAVTVFDAPGDVPLNAVSPASLGPRVDSQIVGIDTVGYAQVRRFLNISESEYQHAVESGGADDPINIVRHILAKTWSDHRAAMSLYTASTDKPRLLMVSYDGTDAINHLFAPYHPPKRDEVSDEAYRKYWPAVENYYAEIDRLLGEWMNALPEDTTVIVMSAHGFRWGKNRPFAIPRGRSALLDHRNPGMFIAYGAHVTPSRASHALSVYDVAPTVLAILGLPRSTEMPGHLTRWAFNDLAPIDSVNVVSYSEFLGDRPMPISTPAVDPHNYEQLLQTIGHLIDPARNQAPVLDEDQQSTSAAPLSPDKWGAYAYYNNLGIQLRQAGKLQPASEAFQKASELNPNHATPLLNLAMVQFDRQQYTAADEAFYAAVAKGLPDAERHFADFAALYRERNMFSRAIALLYKGKEMFPQSPTIAANLGSSLVAAERYTEGVPELERALGLQPSSTLVLDNLGSYYAKRNDFARALDYWNRSLSIDSHQPQVRASADAVRSRL